MCWREDNPGASLAEMQDIQRRNRLQQRNAVAGDDVYIYRNCKVPYFRKKTMFFFGETPMDTTQLVFQTGMRVSFSELPEAVREQFGLTKRNQRATIAVDGETLTFLFDRGVNQPYEPLPSKDSVRFKVIK